MECALPLEPKDTEAAQDPANMFKNDVAWINCVELAGPIGLNLEAACSICV